jgi:hypothetical protein
VTWLGAVWRVAGVLGESGPAGLLAGTAVVAGLLLAAFLAARQVRAGAGTPSVPLPTRRALRAHAGRTGVPRHRDPDAAGHARPRAPSAAHAAA